MRSLFREYGWQFLSHVALPHPLRTIRAFFRSGALDLSGEVIVTSDKTSHGGLEGTRSIVGMGFCLKPMEPPCPSGRPNHDCHYLENILCYGSPEIPACCRECTIREIGLMSLQAGAAFYIMTSAKDILFDVFVPALDEGRFSTGFFVLCRYSFRPFAVGLLASGIRARLFAFESGDCRDYRTWLQADRGVKHEQTEINERNKRTIRELLANATKEPAPEVRFRRRGNIFYAV